MPSVPIKAEKSVSYAQSLSQHRFYAQHKKRRDSLLHMTLSGHVKTAKSENVYAWCGSRAQYHEIMRQRPHLRGQYELTPVSFIQEVNNDT